MDHDRLRVRLERFHAAGQLVALPESSQSRKATNSPGTPGALVAPRRPGVLLLDEPDAGAEGSNLNRTIGRAVVDDDVLTSG